MESVKIPKKMAFRSLSQALDEPQSSPEEMIPISELDAIQSHYALRGLLEFHEKHNSLPNLNNEEEANECLKYIEERSDAMQKNSKVPLRKLNKSNAFSIVKLAKAEIVPLTAFIGGIAAQEVLKVRGKYTPIHQWLHYDLLETLPSGTDIKRATKNCRYDDYLAIYGETIMNRLENLKLFMVGAGALGCELVKGFALMGVCTKGMLHCTDNDHIELTNLNRQFLFDTKDIGHPKSEKACAAAKRINPALQYQAYKDLVTPDTENKFTEEFWDSQDMIIGAVDNMMARRYVNEKCLWHNKAYLDSGTMGPRCNNAVIIPELTESYLSIPDPAQDENFPMCTVRNFPSRIEHTIEWGRSLYENTFSFGAQTLQNFVKDPKLFMIEMKKSQTAEGLIECLEQLKDFVELKNSKNIENCAAYSRQIFENKFNNAIQQLLFLFPLDCKDEYGVPFWTGTKHPPQALNFDSSDELHMLFVNSFAFLLCKMLKINFEPEKEGKKIIETAKAAVCKTFIPKKTMKIVLDEKKEIEQKAELVGKFEETDEKVVLELYSKIISTHLIYSIFRWY